MESKKINQLATNVAPQSTDLTIIGDPVTGVSKKITLLQIANLFATIGTVTSVAVTETGDALTITGSPITTSGTINIGFAGTSGQYINGAGGLTTFPDLSGFVTLGTTQTITGTKIFNADIRLNKTDSTGGVLNIKRGTFIGGINDFTSVFSEGDELSVVSQTSSSVKYAKFSLSGLTSGTTRTYTLPDASGTIALISDIPSLTGYVPYTGATANVNLGTFDLTADVITGATGSFTSSGGSDTFAINHSSGSGIALNITKGGNGEGLYINKTSGSGNAATIIGTLNATTLVRNGGTASQFLMADGSVNTSVLASGAYLPLAGGTLTGALSGTSATFSGLINTTAGNAINSGGTSFAISPSATRGVINLGGSSDNFLTFANKAYIGVGSNYMQVLAQTGVALSLVSDANTVLSFALSTGAATFSSSVGVGGSADLSQKLVVNQGATAINQGIPATSGTTQNGIFRLRPSTSLYGESFDFGMNVSASPYAWIQATNAGGLNVNYPLILNPNGGNVGIGRTPTTNILEINGDASKTSAGSWLANSDINIKTDINTIQGALERINKVRLVSFKYKDEYKEVYTSIKDKYYQNVIAQEYQEIYPDYVYDSGEIFEEHNILQVDTNPMFVDSVSAIQELSKIVQEQQAQIESQDAQIEELKALIAAK